jgi:hypothetical protein
MNSRTSVAQDEGGGTEMKCVNCGVETGFEWPKDEKIRLLWQRAWEGPLCKACAGDSPLQQLMDEETKNLVYALRKKKV